MHAPSSSGAHAHTHLVPGLCLLSLPLLASSHSADLDFVQLGRELVIEHKRIRLSDILHTAQRSLVGANGFARASNCTRLHCCATPNPCPDPTAKRTGCTGCILHRLHTAQVACILSVWTATAPSQVYSGRPHSGLKHTNVRDADCAHQQVQCGLCATKKAVKGGL